MVIAQQYSLIGGSYTYYQGTVVPGGNLTTYFPPVPLKPNLHSPERRLIELRMEHGDLDALIDQATAHVPKDELMMRRLKKKRLALRDEIARVEREIDPNEFA